MHSNDMIKYKQGRTTSYYWIIFKERNLRIGPLSQKEFEAARANYKVSTDLELKSVYE